MNQDQKDLIIKHFEKLMKECDVDSLKKPLVNKGIFKERDITDIFSTKDEIHNKRIFFFDIQKKHNAWFPFLEALRETNQKFIADLFVRKGATVFNEMMVSPDTEELPSSLDLGNIKIPVNNTTETLKVKVITSDTFYDTVQHNGNVDCYRTRSKKRGRVLIINNYEFHTSNHPYRNGAVVDDKNLKELFEQMGGWELNCYNNKTSAEMDMIIKNFANYENNCLFDICFIIIMSHGSEINNETIIYGTDETYIHVSMIEKLFSNENCRTWSTKPKVMLFQTCRGGDPGYPIHLTQKTENDSASRNSQATNTTTLIHLRADEDMLIGYSTLMGYKSHRDFNRGSWYIELLCQEFMNNAHNHSVNDMMLLIDQGLRRRMSEKNTMQTAEFKNRGFKKLYLNPGIYFENETKKQFRSNE